MTDEAALLAAIRANPDEDTPRLAFADWLDEQGDPLRAEFVRVQVALAAGTPADPDYPDLLERQTELNVLLTPRVRELAGEVPNWFRFPSYSKQRRERDWRRGFPYCVRWERSWLQDPLRLDRLRDSLDKAVTRSTVRGLMLDGATPEELEQVLGFPTASDLSTLDVATDRQVQTGDEHAAALAASPAALTLRELDLDFAVSDPGSDALADAPFDELTEFDLPALRGGADSARRLTAAPWFGRLTRLGSRGGNPDAVAAIAGAAARLPDLRELDLLLREEAFRLLVAPGGFPRLGRLSLANSTLGPDGAALLTRAAFPRLALLDLDGTDLDDWGLTRLCSAGWFENLRVFDAIGTRIGDAGVAALAGSSAAAGLRMLRLGSCPFGPAGLAELGTRFPALTTLDLGSLTGLDPPDERAAALARFTARRLRHLNLDGWPLGDAGAKALAANTAFASLTRLSLNSCRIGDTGAEALFHSPHLQGLIQLQLAGNEVKEAVFALEDPGPLPRLASATLGGNKVTTAGKARLTRARPYFQV